MSAKFYKKLPCF